MKFWASLPEFSEATFNIPVKQINFVSYLLSDAQIDLFIQINNLIVNPKKDMENSFGEETKMQVEDGLFVEKSVMSEFKSTNNTDQSSVLSNKKLF